MRTLFPYFKLQREVGHYLWYGDFQPTPTMEVYRVRIGYRLDVRPDIKVMYPKLVPRSTGEAIPHTYPKNRLCLYKPGTGQWNGEMFLADTIVPWTSLWLFYYETWHYTGEWLGGGEHPPRKSAISTPALAHREN